jgi:hypothetical protein
LPLTIHAFIDSRAALRARAARARAAVIGAVTGTLPQTIHAFIGSCATLLACAARARAAVIRVMVVALVVVCAANDYE